MKLQGGFYVRLLHDQMKAVFLGHLSRENNYEALAYETVCSEVTMGENPWNSEILKSLLHTEGRFLKW